MSWLPIRDSTALFAHSLPKATDGRNGMPPKLQGTRVDQPPGHAKPILSCPNGQCAAVATTADTSAAIHAHVPIAKMPYHPLGMVRPGLTCPVRSRQGGQAQSLLRLSLAVLQTQSFGRITSA